MGIISNVLAVDKIVCVRQSETLDPAAEMMDERSFHAFYHRTATPLRAYVARVLGNVTHADDIVQEAYLRLLRKPPPTEDPQQLRAFLFRIAGNSIADYWRQRRRERAAPGEFAAVTATSDLDVPLRVDMARVFRQLNPKERQLMWMAYVEGAEHREIAAALGLRDRSVRVLLHRARRKLARLLQQSGQGER